MYVFTTFFVVITWCKYIKIKGTCNNDSECFYNQACVDYHCIDLCKPPSICGLNANCTTRAHKTGNIYFYCYVFRTAITHAITVSVHSLQLSRRIFGWPCSGMCLIKCYSVILKQKNMFCRYNCYHFMNKFPAIRTNLRKKSVLKYILALFFKPMVRKSPFSV